MGCGKMLVYCAIYRTIADDPNDFRRLWGLSKMGQKQFETLGLAERSPNKAQLIRRGTAARGVT
jgi:hypothetical protein